MNRPTSLDFSGFSEDAVMGANTMPSSDIHDGAYTGIQIQNFKEHNNEYLTFDVSFVEDTAAPVIVTGKNELPFKETIKLTCNEHIYKGKHWIKIQAPDPNGNALDAAIILPHYSQNEIEITFKTDAYKDGYQLAFPQGALKDSSGNELAAATLTAAKENFFFPQEEGLTVITGLWARQVSDAK